MTTNVNRTYVGDSTNAPIYVRAGGSSTGTPSTRATTVAPAVTVTVTHLELPPSHFPVRLTMDGHQSEARSIEPSTEKWADSHRELLVKAGYKEIVIHGTHQYVMSGDAYRYNSDKSILHIYNWTIPSTSITGSQIRFSSDALNEDIIMNGENIRLAGGKSSAFVINNDVDEAEITPGLRLIYDDAKTVIATLYSNSLCITFDIIHSADDNDELMAGILDRMFSLTPPPKIVTLREINVENLLPKMKQSFGEYKKTNDFQARMQDISYKMESAWDSYLQKARQYTMQYRNLKRSSMTDEEFLEKCTNVAKNITENPFLLGCNITARDAIRVTLKSLPSTYWNGVRNVVCTIPLMSKENSEINIYVRELKHDNSLRNLPTFHQVIYGDGRICMGSMGNTIVKMLMNGDWDVAVMMTIRGLIGNDEAFRQWLEIYREAKRDATPEDVILKKTPKEILRIYDEDGSRGDRDSDDDDDEDEEEDDE